MIPAQFDYVRPGSVAEACEVLADDEDAKVLAGGQSLLPLLRLRLAYPSTLVDVGRLDELKGVHDRGDHVYIGALATHDEVMRSPVVRAGCPLVAQATAHVADPAIRHRGTFGGSLAHADPAGDLPAVVLALVYGPAAQLKLAEMGKVGEQIAAGNGLPAYNLIWRAFQISFYEPGWALALPGLVLVYAQLRRRPGAAALLWTWLAAAALFWGIEMATALQARYLVFLAPVACILIGRVLSGLAERGESGRATAWTTVALLLALGCTTWYLGTFQNIQMSMIPLLR